MAITRRTTAEQEVLALIAPLGKLGWFLKAYILFITKFIDSSPNFQ